MGRRFLEGRDLNCLQELIDSAICKVKRDLSSEHHKPEYAGIDLDRLETLKAEVDTYCLPLFIPNCHEEDFMEDEEF